MIAQPPAPPTKEFGANGQSIEDFLYDGSFIRVLIGGRGSGKTRGLAQDITAHLWLNAGGKAIVARETQVSQDDSSIDTFWQYFETLGPAYQPGLGLFRSWNNGRTFRVPSRLAIERMQRDCASARDRATIADWILKVGDSLCGYIEFRGLPDADKGKFRGMECSYLALVEADQITKKQFDLSLACLRWKGADPETCDQKGFIRDRSVVLDSNPPGPEHWIAKMEDEEAQKPEAERVTRFWHICTYENEHNLPENYIRDTILLPYSGNPAMIERMLYGRYADAYDGSPVYYNFSIPVHEGRDLPWPRGAYLMRGHDVGTNAATIWSAYWVENGTEYWHDLYEFYLEGSDTDRHVNEVIKLTESEFPFWNDRGICAGVEDFIDPAAANSSYTKQIVVDGKSVKESALNIFRTYGIYPRFQTASRGLMETIGIVNRLLAKRDAQGRPVYRVDAKGCPRLTRGLHGGYRWPPADERGGNENVPLKGEKCENLDHCFTAGTMIATDRGQMPVENIREGDRVMTTAGFQPVVRTMNREALVSTYEFSDGTMLTGTPEHPVWSEYRQAWIPLAEWMPVDTVKAWNLKQKLACFVGGFTAAIQSRIADPTKCISNTRGATFIGTCGNSLTGQSRPECTSITSTAIQGTTTSQTLNASRQKSTSVEEDGTTQGRVVSSHARQSKKPSPPPEHGTPHQKAEHGTESTQGRMDSETFKLSTTDATIAVKPSSFQLPEERRKKPGFAPINARQHGEGKAVSMTWTERARSAARFIARIATQRTKPVRIVAVHPRQKCERVFNITVENQPEYFANGILVHNCQDAARYSKINALRLLKLEIEQKAKPTPWNMTKPKPANPRRRI